MCSVVDPYYFDQKNPGPTKFYKGIQLIFLKAYTDLDFILLWNRIQGQIEILIRNNDYFVIREAATFFEAREKKI